MKLIADLMEGKLEAVMENRFVNYTTIAHPARIRMGLTNNDYCIADMVHQLSHQSNAMGGWCYASKETLGKYIGISKQSVHKILKKLITKGLIEKHPITSYLRSTPKWFGTVVAEKKLIKKRAVNKGYS